MRQLGDVDQAVDLGLVQLHEQAEAGHAADHAFELAADVLFHPGRAETLIDFALGFVSTALTLGALQRQRRHFARGVGVLLARCAGQGVLDRTVHQQIRVTADRRGEVCIRLQRQAEVAVVVRRIHRQRLAAQQHRFQQGRIRTLAHLLQQLGVIARLHLVPCRQAQLELLEEFQQVGELGLRWPLVHAERRRDMRGQQVTRCLDVGGNHAFFDQLVRVVAHHHAGLRDLAPVVEHEAHFRGFKLDGAAALACLGQDAIQLVQALDLRQQRADEGLGVRVVLAHRIPHLRVGQARVRVHHRFVELRAGDLPIAAHLHVADKAHAVFLRPQRTDAVGQRLRQHRHHEAGEIHRRRAALRLVIQRCAGTHVVGHVGDGHHQTEAVVVRFAVHRVIEVLGVLAIDGHQRHRTQVHALADHRRLHRHRDGGGFVQHFRREFIRQFVAVDGGFHHQRWGQLVAQHGDDLADRRASRIRRVGQFAHHQLAILRTAGRFTGDLDVALDALVIGHHIVDAGFHAEMADQAVDAAFQHARDAAFAAAPAVDAGDVGQRTVTMHHLAHFVGRQEEIVAAFVRAQEAEAFRVGDHHTGDQAQCQHRGETATAVLHQLAVAHHRAQALGQRISTVGFGQAKLTTDFLGVLRALAALQQLQDGFAAGNRLRIAFRFTGGIGIVDRHRRACRRLAPAAHEALWCCRSGVFGFAAAGLGGS
ncbi:hypothetical protein D3C81_683270 [compost metagenome]